MRRFLRVIKVQKRYIFLQINRRIADKSTYNCKNITRISLCGMSRLSYAAVRHCSH